jgi:transcription-repair coupling factor (superfamily II helicase)
MTPAGPPKAPALLPLRYMPESRHRIEIYRKLAQATDLPSLDRLRGEIRDRFGPLPPRWSVCFSWPTSRSLRRRGG